MGRMYSLWGAGGPRGLLRKWFRRKRSQRSECLAQKAVVDIMLCKIRKLNLSDEACAPHEGKPPRLERRVEDTLLTTLSVISCSQRYILSFFVCFVLIRPSRFSYSNIIQGKFNKTNFSIAWSAYRTHRVTKDFPICSLNYEHFLFGYETAKVWSLWDLSFCVVLCFCLLFVGLLVQRILAYFNYSSVIATESSYFEITSKRDWLFGI